ncbi:RNA ligase [Phorcysia thermohydrogeniphila]|uniref:RNA ligase n=1 Tax=Phorcysia thermohydrogeniphila TaxID=936138 RepID=A0A4R1GBV6_9BACT|nr:RNA ligase [Phorcysia thermohydrogeniphila]TCK03985.1 RNA ligase [Phorcysia thermohydrogeniphila]
MKISLEEVLKEIEGNKFFKVIEEGGLLKVSYRFNAPFVFDTPLKRELRGITFNRLTGEVVSRPFHKFFNLNEIEESKEERLKGKEFIFREKLDGTMVHFALYRGELLPLTQKSFKNEQTERAKEIVEKDDKLRQFILSALKKGITPIFELLSPDFQIVVPVSEEKLYLTELRQNNNGKYLLERYEREISELGIPLPKKRVLTLEGALKELEGTENIEGFVLKDFSKEEPFPLFVKLKSPWYHERHYIFTYLHNIPDHKLFKLFLDGKADEFFSKLTNKKLKRNRMGKLKKLVDLYIELTETAKELSPLYGKKNFERRVSKETERIKSTFSRDFKKLQLSPSFLRESARVASKGGKFEKFIGMKLYSLLKEKEIELKQD